MDVADDSDGSIDLDDTADRDESSDINKIIEHEADRLMKESSRAVDEWFEDDVASSIR